MAKRVIRAHVLLLPYPAQGHINPMLRFAKHLLSKGVEATLITRVFISKSMHTKLSSSRNVEVISAGFDEGGYVQVESPETYLKTFRTIGSQTLVYLINKLDEFLPWALDIAKQF